MHNINILSPHVSDLIAAGEVVERPGAAVKELIENSIDAGAKNITLDIKGGGMTCFHIHDDGCGMSPEDAGIAFLRHATSKISRAENLEAIGTLGFRGEALAATAAVSRIELLTRERSSDTGTRMLLDAGEILEMDAAGCPYGTSITVRDLFYNTPARLKFMKSDRAESSYCRDIALRCALGNPGISISCSRDGKADFHSPGDGSVQSAVYSLLGKDTASSMLPCESEDDGVSVSGLISSPRHGRGNRSNQFFFCNGRYIKSTVMQAALEQAYRNSMLTGRFPYCVLYLNLNFALVDVNVHPSKTEVKFSNERKVFDSVYYACLSALNSEAPAIHIPPIADDASKKDMHSAEESLFNKSRSADRTRPGESTVLSSPPGGIYSLLMPAEKSINTQPLNSAPPTKKPPFLNEQLNIPGVHDIVNNSDAPDDGLDAAPANTQPPHASQSRSEASVGDDISVLLCNPIRIIGEAMGTYIIAEQGETMLLIDKHAAHERIIFDRLKRENQNVMSQLLMTPVTASPGEECTAQLLSNSSLLSRLGFDIEALGDDSIIMRSIPCDTDISDAPSMLEAIADCLLNHMDADFRDEVLHMVACKAAIKAGRMSQPRELEDLAVRVFSGEIKYCPHGRPVSVAIDKKELDKRFSRIVS